MEEENILEKEEEKIKEDIKLRKENLKKIEKQLNVIDYSQHYEVGKNMKWFCIIFKSREPYIEFFTARTMSVFDIITINNNLLESDSPPFLDNIIIKFNLDLIEKCFQSYQSLRLCSLITINTNEDEMKDAAKEEYRSRLIETHQNMIIFPNKGIIYPSLKENFDFGSIAFLELNNIVLTKNLITEISKINLVSCKIIGIYITDCIVLNLKSTVQHLYLDCVPFNGVDKFTIFVAPNTKLKTFTLLNTWLLNKQCFSSVIHIYNVRFQRIPLNSMFKKPIIEEFILDLCPEDLRFIPFTGMIPLNNFFYYFKNAIIKTLIIRGHPCKLNDPKEFLTLIYNEMEEENVSKVALDKIINYTEEFKPNFINLYGNRYLSYATIEVDSKINQNILYPFAFSELENVYIDLIAASFICITPDMMSQSEQLKMIAIQTSYGYPPIYVNPPAEQGKEVKRESREFANFFLKKKNNIKEKERVTFEFRDGEKTHKKIDQFTLFTLNPSFDYFNNDSFQIYLDNTLWQNGYYIPTNVNAYFRGDRNKFTNPSQQESSACKIF